MSKETLSEELKAFRAFLKENNKMVLGKLKEFKLELKSLKKKRGKKK